jgi:hypothetical protein
MIEILLFRDISWRRESPERFANNSILAMVVRDRRKVRRYFAGVLLGSLEFCELTYVAS